MAGRQEFQTVVAQAPRKSLKFITATLTANLAVNATENTDLYSAPNTISKVIAIYCSIPVPVGGASGTHRMYLQNGVSGGHFITGCSLFGDPIVCDYMTIVKATSDKSPIAEDAQIIAMSNIQFDSITPLRFQYLNNTNVIQTGQRQLILTVEETVLG